LSYNIPEEAVPTSVDEAFELERHLAEAPTIKGQWDVTCRIVTEEQLLLHR